MCVCVFVQREYFPTKLQQIEKTHFSFLHLTCKRISLTVFSSVEMGLHLICKRISLTVFSSVEVGIIVAGKRFCRRFAVRLWASDSSSVNCV